MSHVLPPVERAVPVDSMAEAGAYIETVCFKHGPPRLVGIELEWFAVDATGRRPGAAVLAAALRTALGPHAPRSLVPDSPAEPLPAGSPVSLEPGGQVELSPPPAADLADLLNRVRADVAELDSRLSTVGLRRTAIPPAGSADRVLRTPRYDAMERAFDAIGPMGRAMMCRTAALQVCVDLGERAGPASADQRWRLAHALGPVLTAAFGTQQGRLDAWWGLDPRRTLPPTEPGIDAYVDRVLDTPVLATRARSGAWEVDNDLTPRDWFAAGRLVTTADLDLHLSTIFPPVRPQGYLELRYLDAQPGEGWLPVLAVVAAAFSSPAAVESALAVCTPTASRWSAATSAGLSDPQLERAAADLHAVVDEALPTLRLAEPDDRKVREHIARRLLQEAA